MLTPDEIKTHLRNTLAECAKDPKLVEHHMPDSATTRWLVQLATLALDQDRRIAELERRSTATFK